MIRFHVTLIQSCRLDLPVISCRIYIVVIGDKTVLFKEYFRARKLPEKVRSEREVLPDKNRSVFLMKFPGSATGIISRWQYRHPDGGMPDFFSGNPASLPVAADIPARTRTGVWCLYPLPP
jgi:hypothetical protein